MKLFRKKLKNQNGQGVMEYLILTGLIGIFCLAAVKKFGKSINTRINNMNEKIQKEIEIK